MNLKSALESAGIELGSEKIGKLDIFIEKLLWYNGVHNISGAKSYGAVAENIVDSLLPINFVPKPASFLDVGTGAGFPGLVLAIAWDESECTLAEPINKRASFLRLVSHELGLKNVTVFKDRVEKLQSKPFDLITSRAVTNSKLLLELTKNVSSLQTQYLFYKGTQVFDEVKELNSKLKYDIVQKNKRNYLWIKPDA